MFRQFSVFLSRCGIVITAINLFVMGWWVYMSWAVGTPAQDGTEDPLKFSYFRENVQLGLTVITPFAVLGIALIVLPTYLALRRSKRAA